MNREEIKSEYTNMPILDLLDTRLNGSFIPVIADDVIMQRVGGMEKEIDRLGSIIMEELGGTV